MRYAAPPARRVPMMSDDWTPTTYENCHQVDGPFYHGTKARPAVGDHLTTGHPSHFEEGRVLAHVYFSARLESAIWGAELAVALSGADGRGFVYVVEPTGPFEDDPNLTNKKFPGNPTRSYRTRDALRIVGVVEDWVGHSAEALQAMLTSLEALERRGEAVIED